MCRAAPITARRLSRRKFGIAAGTATGEFQPQQSMTRQDAMVFLKRTIDRTALKLGTGSVSSFSDASRISNYAKPSVSALVGAKVIGGSKGKINPLSNQTNIGSFDGSNSYLIPLNRNSFKNRLHLNRFVTHRHS